MYDTRLLIRPFTLTDQEAARKLILAGLGEHFGFIDETCNPDIDDIFTCYIASGHTFIIAEINEQVVGTGALISESELTGRIVRMSVARGMRRTGIGQALMERLIHIARERKHMRLVLETNIGWNDAIRFYQHCGFQENARTNKLTHMALDLF